MTTPTIIPTTTEVTNKVIDRKHTEITKLPTFAARGVAIAKRLESVKADPKYQALSDEHKAKIRADIYHKYVPASYQGFHLPIPDEKTWIGATGRDTSIRFSKDVGDQLKLSQTYKDSKTKQFAMDTMVGMGKAYDQIGLFGAKVSNKIFAKMHGLDEYYSHSDSLLGKISQASLPTEKKVSQKINNFIDAQHSRIQSSDFWLQVHPRDTIIGKLGSLTGESIATLPLYEAVGSVGLGTKIVRGVPLTAKLTASPVGQFVAKRLIEASDGYLSSLAGSGGSNKEGLAGAASFAAMGSVGKVLKVAAAPLIKKWTANTIAMGGKPFAQDIAESAYHEMQPLDWLMKNATEHRISGVQNIHELGGGIAILPKSETEGHFLKDGKTYYYNGIKERQLMFNHLHQDHLQVRETVDPVMHKLHEAEKATLDSIAVQKFKKPLNAVEDEQKLNVLGTRFQQIHEAAQEAPVHLPELLEGEIEQNLKKARQSSPVLNQFMEQDEKLFGAKFSKTQTDNTVERVAKQTGISNSPAAARKTRKIVKEVYDKSTNLDTKGFASYRIDTNSYLRGPRDRKNLAASISDKSKAGYDKLYSALKSADGGKIKFETPVQRFLFHYGNNPEPGLKQALAYRIKQTKGYESYKAADIAKESSFLMAHLYELASGGQLAAGESVFASSKFSGPYSWTKWQNILSKENDAEWIDLTNKALKQHPEAQKAFKSLVSRIRKMSIKVNNGDEYIALKQKLHDSSLDAITNVRK